jgi:hypothetical protein
LNGLRPIEHCAVVTHSERAARFMYSGRCHDIPAGKTLASRADSPAARIRLGELQSIRRDRAEAFKKSTV